MQDSPSAVSSPTSPKRAPLHDEIAQCARDIWIQQGQPANRDQGIWLEAEQRLQTAAAAQGGTNSAPVASLGLPPAQPARPSGRSTAATGGRAVFAVSSNPAVKATQGGKNPAR